MASKFCLENARGMTVEANVCEVGTNRERISPDFRTHRMFAANVAHSSTSNWCMNHCFAQEISGRVPRSVSGQIRPSKSPDQKLDSRDHTALATKEWTYTALATKEWTYTTNNDTTQSTKSRFRYFLVPEMPNPSCAFLGLLDAVISGLWNQNT